MKTTHIDPNICAECKNCVWILKRCLDSVQLICTHVKHEKSEGFINYPGHDTRSNFLMMLSHENNDYWFLRNFIGKKISFANYGCEHVVEFKVGFTLLSLSKKQI